MILLSCFSSYCLAPTGKPGVGDQMCRSCFSVMVIISVWHLWENRACPFHLEGPDYFKGSLVMQAGNQWSFVSSCNFYWFHGDLGTFLRIPICVFGCKKYRLIYEIPGSALKCQFKSCQLIRSIPFKKALLSPRNLGRCRSSIHTKVSSQVRDP